MPTLNGDQLLEMFVRGALGRSGRKSARRVVQVVGGKSGLLSASTLLAAAGVAWGVYETMQAQKTGAAAAPAGGAAPPVPPMTGGMPSSAPPPVPGAESAAATAPPEVTRIVRLAVSAANADGAMSDTERSAILQHARDAGVEAIAHDELTVRRPLAEIVDSVTADAERRDLYMLAFAIVRADEGVSGAERIYLAQLAHALGLGPEITGAIERDTAAAIERT
ncbi:DUF533 domain-containing protein [uncultured Phenylobacterium sp.]|uniref:DUF533 domain-containing protein n=1 Tax=uncultured Phenylobacterium sp. TaxID=349273 RepID=UPI0025E71045|nr:DUF533 domain-containing protein [uncultured Phenylobacterium sp.]